MTAAFDPLAESYDADFSETMIARYLRAQVYWRLRRHFKPETHILELGSGTGEDALWLAQRGMFMTATDASSAMLAITAKKLYEQPYARTKHLDLNALPDDQFDYLYDGVLANFGVINCVADLGALAAWLSERVARGRKACFGMMGRYCIWEFLWHGFHLDFGAATRRFSGEHTAFGDDGAPTPIAVYYPRVDELKRIFAPYFKVHYVMPLGLWLPPSDVYGVFEKRPRLTRLLQTLDKRIGRISQFADYADHYWIEFTRK